MNSFVYAGWIPSNTAICKRLKTLVCLQLSHEAFLMEGLQARFIELHFLLKARAIRWLMNQFLISHQQWLHRNMFSFWEVAHVTFHQCNEGIYASETAMGLGVLTLCQCCALGKTQLKHIWKEQSGAKCHRPKQPLLCPSLSLGRAFCIESVLVVWHGLLQSKEFQHHNASPSLRNQVHKPALI